MLDCFRLVDSRRSLPRSQHGCGGTPLHHTLAGGYLELAIFLLDNNADVNAANLHGAPRVRAPTRRGGCLTRVGLVAGTHPLHIAVKREYTDCIRHLMAQKLPIEKVRDELGWAVRFDLCASVFCLLDCGAPHGIGVLSPWSAAPTTCQVGSAAQPPSRPPALCAS